MREIDISDLHGVVRGFQRGEVGTARAALQSLMLAHGFEARERDGLIRFAMRDGRLDARLAKDDMAAHPDFAGPWERVLSPEAETAGRVRIGFVEAEGDFETGGPGGMLFFMGGNRDNSGDSRRSLGFVPRENVVGRAVGIWFVLNGKWGRIGQGVD